MNTIPVNELKISTYYTEPVYLDNGYIILTPDVPVTTDLINRLGTWGFRTVQTEGTLAEGPIETRPTESASGEIAQSLEDEKQFAAAREHFIKVVKFLDDAFIHFKASEEINIVSFTDITKDMIAELKANRRFMLSLDDNLSPTTVYIVTHSVKTAFLALALADYLKMPPFKQIDIGIAALLHEIGLLKIPESIYLSKRSLTPNERKALVAHPVLGFRILRTASFPATVCQAVLEHNERIDGSGYPRRVTGEKTSQYGKILAVASSYNASVSKRPYKSAFDGHAGLLDLMKDAGKRYDEKILVALVYILSLYPIGTHIVMSNGAIGTVVQPNPEDPKHPVVKLLVDENGNRYQNPPVVHTRKGDKIEIARAINKEELAKIRARA